MTGGLAMVRFGALLLGIIITLSIVGAMGYLMPSH
jgi:hypothetical protein